MGHCALMSSVLDLLLVLGCSVATSYAKYVPFLQQGFFFDYNIESQPVPIPITEQCETIHLEWSREAATGPSPVAPYSMVVYTSTFIVPFTIATGDGPFDWQVPFAPGTQYQICMWDANGVPGGCQAMYTVIQNSTVANPTCTNITFPALLQVEATVPSGPMSQFGWIDQCTDLFITPKSGNPPFTLTVAPALHPPYNITSTSMSTIDWTVSLSWSSPFFISLASSDGQMWSNGPLHAGGSGPSDCLAPGSIPASKAHNLAIGAGIGGAFAAAILGALAAFMVHGDYLGRLRRSLRRREPPTVDSFEHGLSPANTPQKSPQRFTSTVSDLHASQPVSPPVHSPSQIILSPASSQPLPRPRTYLLHQDAGRAPLTVITDDAEVVELPPRYRRDNEVIPRQLKIRTDTIDGSTTPR